MLTFLAVNAALPVGFFTVAFENYFYERYRAVNFFGVHISAVWFCILMIAFTVIAAFAGAMLLKTNLREYRFIEKLKKILYNRRSRSTQTKTAVLSEHYHTLLIWEMQKMVFNYRSAAILLLLFILRCAIQNEYFTPAMTGDTVVYNTYVSDIAELGGKPEDAEPYIAEEAEYIARATAEYTDAVLKYREDRITADEYHEISSRYHYAEHVSGGFNRLIEQQNYLRHMSGQYENIGYVDEDGVKKFLFPDFDVVFVFVILFLVSDLFSAEYQGGFAAIQRLTRFGRNEIQRVKYLAAFLTISVIWLIFTAVDLLLLFRRFPLNGLHFGMMSIKALNTIGWNLPVWAYMLLNKISVFLGAGILTVFSAAISTLAAQNLKSVMILFMTMLTPYLLSVFGITLFDIVNIKYLLAPEFPYSLYQLLLYSLITVILCARGIRKWNG